MNHDHEYVELSVARQTLFLKQRKYQVLCALFSHVEWDYEKDNNTRD